MAKTKILIVSDSAALPTGYAESTRLIFGSLLEAYPDEYEIHQLALHHCYAVTKPMWRIYPTRVVAEEGSVRFDQQDLFGRKSYPELLRLVRPDIVFAFGDIDRIAYMCTPRSQRTHSLVVYVTVDAVPVERDEVALLRNADCVCAMSNFASRVLREHLFGIRLETMYSPADTSRFTPASADERAALRCELLPKGISNDCFLIGWVGRNQWRKQNWVLYSVCHYLSRGDYLVCNACERVSILDWDPVLRQSGASVEFARSSDPRWDFASCIYCGSSRITSGAPLDDVHVWIHTPEDDPDGDWPAARLERQFGVKRGREIIYTEGLNHKAALAPESMPYLFKIWDCMAYLSGGEGFGVPAWEAMACALPLVYTNYSAHAEFISSATAGIPVGGVFQPEKGGLWRLIADIGQSVAAFLRLRADGTLREKLGANGRSFAERFSVHLQSARWHSIFQDVSKKTRVRA